MGRAVTQAVNRRPLTAEPQVRARVSACGVCGGQSGIGTVFPPSSSVFPSMLFHRGSILMYHLRDKQ
jgi:hypothetical protein